MYRWTDRNSHVLHDFVPFRTAALKANWRVPGANLMVLRAHSRASLRVLGTNLRV